MKWYKNLSYHWQALIKTAGLSFILIWVPYCFVYWVSLERSKSEVMARQDPHFTSDILKMHIRDFNKRKIEGKVESTFNQSKEVEIDETPKTI